MTRPAIQLHTLRNVDEPLPAVLERVADAGFAGVEFAGRVTESDPAAVAAALEETGLVAAGAHVGIEALEADFAGTVEFYDRLSVDEIVVPWLDPEHFASREAVGAAAERLETLADRLADEGKRLHYHNHDHEYVPLDDATAFDAFVDATAFGIELDLGLSHFAGDDVVARLRALGDRSQLVHLKDIDEETGESTHVGAGDLPLDDIAAAVADNDSDWLVYEYEGDDPLSTLDDAAARTRELCE